MIHALSRALCFLYCLCLSDHLVFFFAGMAFQLFSDNSLNNNFIYLSSLDRTAMWAFRPRSFFTFLDKWALNFAFSCSCKANFNQDVFLTSALIPCTRDDAISLLFSLLCCHSPDLCVFGGFFFSCGFSVFVFEIVVLFLFDFFCICLICSCVFPSCTHWKEHVFWYL